MTRPFWSWHSCLNVAELSDQLEEGTRWSVTCVASAWECMNPGSPQMSSVLFVLHLVGQKCCKNTYNVVRYWQCSYVDFVKLIEFKLLHWLGCQLEFVNIHCCNYWAKCWKLQKDGHIWDIQLANCFWQPQGLHLTHCYNSRRLTMSRLRKLDQHLKFVDCTYAINKIMPNIWKSSQILLWLCFNNKHY